MQELEIEKQNLSAILSDVQEVLTAERKELKDLYTDFVGSDDELAFFLHQKDIHIKNLEYALDHPYFARIDFTFSDNHNKQKFYIGKNGVIKDSNIIITDWRSPISSLYYDAEVGPATFIAPEGSISGVMDLKRQYVIEEGKLIDYFDVNLVSNDMLLQKYLNTNNDNRLKTIVATIQKEQNEVIRKPIEENIIIQGVAGSGKTTVALHRIAYLVYNYMKLTNQKDYLVIGPNPVFIKYIKSVLPDLDVSSVTQVTFEEFATKYIEEKIKINLTDNKINDSIAGKINHDIDKFKCSIKYKNMLDAFWCDFIDELTSKDLFIGNFLLISNKKIKDTFLSTASTFITSLESRINLTIDKLSKEISLKQDSYINKYNDYAFDLYAKEADSKKKDELKNMFNKDKVMIKKGCRNLIRAYFDMGSLKPTKIYKQFLNRIMDYNIYDYDNLKLLQTSTLKNLKKGVYDFEDLAPLVYLKNKLTFKKEYATIRHTVIDEAQDLGEFNFFVFKCVLPSSTFSIFGDLAQSIYDYRGVDNWDDVNKSMFDNNASIIKFTKSYRTTAEIMNVADAIALSIGLDKSDLVVRHGNKVKFNKVTKDTKIEHIINKVKEYQSKGYLRIAIISKTNELSISLNKSLKEKGLDIPNISLGDDMTDKDYLISTVGASLAKGLEFDAVILNDASNKIYKSDNKLDMKLLYVAVTRALHEVDILYSDNLPEPLEKLI